MIRVTFMPMNQAVEALPGQSLLEVAHAHGIHLEGACEGSLACSTCHVVVDAKWYDHLDPAEEEEEDILERAFGLTATSRLSCQIIMQEELDGLIVTIPAYSVNISVDKKGGRS
ncbi:MAG: 2Fe-2S iron-sulfur cluster-binding protein [Magnetococcus sp. YQC-5]